MNRIILIIAVMLLSGVINKSYASDENSIQLQKIKELCKNNNFDACNLLAQLYFKGSDIYKLEKDEAIALSHIDYVCSKDTTKCIYPAVIKEYILNEKGIKINAERTLEKAVRVNLGGKTEQQLLDTYFLNIFSSTETAYHKTTIERLNKALEFGDGICQRGEKYGCDGAEDIRKNVIANWKIFIDRFEHINDEIIMLGIADKEKQKIIEEHK